MHKNPAYNAQAVGEESGIAQLVPMLEEVEANLGKVAEETLGDGGYGSAEQLGKAVEKGYEMLTAPGGETGGVKRGEYVSENFRCKAAAEEVICPQKQRLRFEGKRKKSGKQGAVRSYRCQHFAQCPVRELCSRSQSGRRIEISPQRAAVERQRAKRAQPAKQALLRRRKVIIEPVLAIIKQMMGFRRWTVRGLENVRTQWALLCTAYNMKKIYRSWAAAHALAPA